MKSKYELKVKEKKQDGCSYEVTIHIPTENGWIDDVWMNLYGIHSIPLSFIQKEDGIATFKGEFYLCTKALYHFNFSYKVNGEKKVVLDEEQGNIPFKLSVNYEIPDWAKGKIMYHIFVDRFNRANSKEKMPNRDLHASFEEDPVIGPNKDGLWNVDYYGGDLQGIIEKLDYIKSLGVSILYLSPIVKSQSNHRYDTGDYLEIDPYAGSKEDLKELCKKAHENGIKVILDAVFNHTGNDSIYYNEFDHYDSLGAYQSENSLYSSFYKKENGEFKYWWGNKNLPVCDGNDPKWRTFITGKNGVIDHWFQCGIDGLRLDVADDLQDDFIELIRTAVRRNKPDGFILGEVWENPMKMNRKYIESGKGLDSVMNYTLMDALIRYYKYEDVEKLKRVLGEMIKDYLDGTLHSLMNFTSTHDISRALEIFGYWGFNPNTKWAWDVNNEARDMLKEHKLTQEEIEKAKIIYKSYIFALTFLPGNLSIFYGDEAGIEGLGNLMNRRPFPWNHMDEDLVRFFWAMGFIREKEPFLEKAKTRIRDINADFFQFERILGDQGMLITVSRSPKEGRILIPPEYEIKRESRVYTLNASNSKILTPYGAIAIKKG